MAAATSTEFQCQSSDPASSRQGGWSTFPFITGTLAGLTLAVSGWGTNLVVYLIQKFHVESIAATQIVNIVSGCTSLLPVIGAIIADSFGCFSVICISAFISLLGTILMALTSILKTLRPQPCESGSWFCPAPTKLQFAVLYSGVALGSIGLGGTRFTIAALGANQFNTVKEQEIFFNWFVVILYASSVTGATVTVYIEDNVSWTLGYGICVVANVISICIFLLGSRLYRHVKPQGSPFMSLARVVVAAIRKRNFRISSKAEDYYHGEDMPKEIVASMPMKTYGFLNRAALITEGDIRSDGSILKPWRLCSQQEVEDLKTLIRIFPILSSGIFLTTPIAVISSLTILQALTVDRHLGPYFKIPAGSMIVFVLTSIAISVTLVDRFLYPIWQKLIGQSPTPLQRIGLGHVFNALGMGIAAIVESKRLEIARSHHLIDQPAGSTVPMLVLWLVPQLVVVGFGEAFHYPGQVTFYYQEFPKSLRSTATSMISMIMGIAYYLSTAIIDLIQRVTGWLPDDINNGRLDNVYWMLLGMAVLNFFYYLLCARFYKYQTL